MYSPLKSHVASYLVIRDYIKALSDRTCQMCVFSNKIHLRVQRCDGVCPSCVPSLLPCWFNMVTMNQLAQLAILPHSDNMLLWLAHITSLPPYYITVAENLKVLQHFCISFN